MRDGATTHTRQQLDRVLAVDCVEALVEAAGWDSGVPHRQGQGLAPRSDLGSAGTREPCALGARLPRQQPIALPKSSPTRHRPGKENLMKHRGRGVACGWYGIARTASMDRAAVWVELDDGGTVKIATGVTEIGEGVLTGLCQIAAQEMGVRPEDIVLGDNDTARVPEAAHAGATRMTYMIGNAVAVGCREAFGKFRDAMGAYWGVAPGSIQAFAGEVWVEGSPTKRMTMAHAVHVLKKEARHRDRRQRPVHLEAHRAGSGDRSRDAVAELRVRRADRRGRGGRRHRRSAGAGRLGRPRRRPGGQPAAGGRPDRRRRGDGAGSCADGGLHPGARGRPPRRASRSTSCRRHWTSRRSLRC